MTNAMMKGASGAYEASVNARMLLAAVLLWAGTSGCEPQELGAESLDTAVHTQELDSTNGISANGISANGISANGISANGLAANGLALNGLASASFSAWFSTDPAASNMLMKYLVRCAVPAGESRSFTDSQTGTLYTWTGNLGLAPGWADGAPATLTEQQLITACLLAHVNQSGMNLPISVLGRDAQGTLIPYTRQELVMYSVHEACFFGNLFTPQGLYFGTDRLQRNRDTLLTRACSVSGDGTMDRYQSAALHCAPLQFAGSCLQRCQVDMQGGPFYKTCTYNGVTYPAITTRMRPQDYSQLVASLDE